jgi:hypothetical protein
MISKPTRARPMPHNNEQPLNAPGTHAQSTTLPGITLRTWGLALIIIVLTIYLRQPTWNDHILFIDETLYYSIGARLELPGAHVHTHTADMKPPGGPVTYWLAIEIDPDHAITVVHVFTTIAIGMTALLLLVTSCLLLGGPWPGFWAGLLYVLLGSSATPKGQLGEPFFAFSGLEHFQAPWLTLFFLAFALSLNRARARYAVLAGLSLAIAAWYKHNVPVLLLPAATAAALAVWRKQLKLPQAVLLTGACAATTLALMSTIPLYYALLGHFAAWRFYTIDLLRIYSGMGGSYRLEAQLLAHYIPLAPFLVAALLYGLASAFSRERRVLGNELRGLLVVGWIVLFASLSAGLHKAHYLIQPLPAQCLLIGLLVAESWQYVTRQSQPRRLALGAAYCALLVVPLGIASFNLVRGWEELIALIQQDYYLTAHRRAGTLEPLVAYIREHSQPEDLIYVHSEAPEFYILTQRRPAASDPGGGWLALLKSNDVADRQLTDLKSTPPRIIVQLDYRRYGRAGETLQKWPQLCTWVYQHYREHTYVDHAQILEWDDTLAATLPAAPEIFLGALPPSSAVQDAGWLRIDRNIVGRPLRLGGHAYEHGIGTHAPSRLSYQLDGTAHWFVADIGIDDDGGVRGAAVFVVEVDGTPQFISPVLHGGAPPVPVRVDVSGAHTLTLAVRPATSYAVPDWTDWGAARLLRDSAIGQAAPTSDAHP